MKKLHKYKYYMNPVTGSVAKGIEWMDDYKCSTEKLSWAAWGGNSLVEVIQTPDKEWVEVV